MTSCTRHGPDRGVTHAPIRSGQHGGGPCRCCRPHLRGCHQHRGDEHDAAPDRAAVVLAWWCIERFRCTDHRLAGDAASGGSLAGQHLPCAGRQRPPVRGRGVEQPAHVQPLTQRPVRWLARWPDTLGAVILIDPPMWPAHRTRFSHLVSDHTLAELHQFAASAGLAERSFDGDHYDVPEERHDQLVALGAVPVSAGELIRRLRASGLRVPARARPERVRAVLGTRWEHLMPGQRRLGTELVERWREPHRRYHTTSHLLDVLTALDQLCAPVVPGRTVRLAAWYHDAVYAGVAGTDEESSAALAEQTLPSAGVSSAAV